MIKATKCLFTSGLFLSLLAGFVLLGSASAGGRDKSNSGVKQGARLGRSFTLKAGRQVTLQGGKLRIKFAAVEEDSRCPSDVTCVWAGNASVRLEVSAGGKDNQNLTLSTGHGATFVSERQYHGYKVRLVGLNPYPRSTQHIAPGDYIATLLVAK
jgi:hypothetical protein